MWCRKYQSPEGGGGGRSGIRVRFSVKILKFKPSEMTFQPLIWRVRFWRFCHFFQILNKEYCYVRKARNLSLDISAVRRKYVGL
jgi:hypothetical protein